MNSSLQCLSHAAPLARMFLSGAYRQDINKDNPLGNRGELAEAFGVLLKLLWQVRGSLLAPPSARQLHLLMGCFWKGVACACSIEALSLVSRPACALLFLGIRGGSSLATSVHRIARTLFLTPEGLDRAPLPRRAACPS